jgi:hypothetical protein
MPSWPSKSQWSTISRQSGLRRLPTPPCFLAVAEVPGTAQRWALSAHPPHPLSMHGLVEQWTPQKSCASDGAPPRLGQVQNL